MTDEFLLDFTNTRECLLIFRENNSACGIRLFRPSDRPVHANGREIESWPDYNNYSFLALLTRSPTVFQIAL